MSSRVLLSVCVLALYGAIARAQTPTVVVQYPYPTGAGAFAPIEGSDGAYYSVLGEQGTSGCGGVARDTTVGIYTALYTFSCQNGSPNYPAREMVQGGDGNFYGATTGGGGGPPALCSLDGCGTIFRLTPAGNLTTLYQFQDNGDGALPMAGLIEGSDGDFYGATTFGGDANQDGTIFRISSTGTYTQLHLFSGGAGGSHPTGPLVQGSDDDFYGITSDGGDAACAASGLNARCGTIFRITPSGDFAVLYSFTGGADGGEAFAGESQSGLVEGSDGAFYGTTTFGGDLSLCGQGCGTIFRITSSGDFTTIYTFENGDDGSLPLDGLFAGGDGDLYGLSSNTSGNILFRVTKSGALTVLYAGSGQPASIDPLTTLLQGDDGNFYGNGVINSVTPPNAFVFYRMSFTPPLAPPVQLSLSQPSIYIGSSVMLSWQVLNAFSTTMQQCYAFVRNGATGAGNWTGLQTGVLGNGVYSGSTTIVPTAVGSYTYALTCGGIETGSVRVVVGAIPPLVITTTSLPSATVGIPYSTGLTAQGGVGTYTWSIPSGAIPPDLSLDAGSGSISGVPTQAGTYGFTAGVQDSRSPPDTASANLSLTVLPGASSLTANPSNLTIAAPGDSAATTLSLSGFTSNSVQFSCAGLPFGTNCSFGSLSGTGEAGTAPMQINTQGAFSAKLESTNPGERIALFSTWVFPGLLSMAVVARKRKRALIALRFLRVLSLIVLSGVVSGCGVQSTGTPPGTYSVTVNATAGNQSASTTVQLMVR